MLGNQNVDTGSIAAAWDSGTMHFNQDYRQMGAMNNFSNNNYNNQNQQFIQQQQQQQQQQEQQNYTLDLFQNIPQRVNTAPPVTHNKLQNQYNLLGISDNVRVNPEYSEFYQDALNQGNNNLPKPLDKVFYENMQQLQEYNSQQSKIANRFQDQIPNNYQGIENMGNFGIDGIGNNYGAYEDALQQLGQLDLNQYMQQGEMQREEYPYGMNENGTQPQAQQYMSQFGQQTHTPSRNATPTQSNTSSTTYQNNTNQQLNQQIAQQMGAVKVPSQTLQGNQMVAQKQLSNQYNKQVPLTPERQAKANNGSNFQNAASNFAQQANVNQTATNGQQNNFQGLNQQGLNQAQLGQLSSMVAQQQQANPQLTHLSEIEMNQMIAQQIQRGLTPEQAQGFVAAYQAFYNQMMLQQQQNGPTQQVQPQGQQAKQFPQSKFLGQNQGAQQQYPTQQQNAYNLGPSQAGYPVRSNFNQQQQGQGVPANLNNSRLQQNLVQPNKFAQNIETAKSIQSQGKSEKFPNNKQNNVKYDRKAQNNKQKAQKDGLNGFDKQNQDSGSVTSTQLQFKYANIDEIFGQVQDVARDQNGCRYLQKQIDEGGNETIQKIFGEVLSDFTGLMMDPFGNYLVQKLLECCSDDQRLAIVQNLASSTMLVTVAQNTHGTRAVQKLVESLASQEEISCITSALKPGVVELIKDLNGNHVIQRCLQKLNIENCQFIYNAVVNNCMEVACHRHGCCVLQRCIDFASEEQKDILLDKISHHALDLAKDAYGNYVVQYLMGRNDMSQQGCLLDRLRGNFAELSLQKFSSNVVEKCLKLQGERADQVREIILREVIESPLLSRILQDAYGNYVVQSALQNSRGKLYNDLVQAIQPHIPILRGTPYGKRILQKVNGKI